ncbi:MAG TPA: DUF2752 domain-containing protein [Pyrinomonadaceae bacterium]|jgi:hypothetical protein|nr:DUF2752 domain-containing protein [Pyrinomonadaceae bacterium]
MATEFMYRRSTVAGIWLLLIAGAVYLFIFEPGRTGFFPVCLFRFLTGLTCPGCGTTRALHAILHGELERAFMLNPLLLLASPLLVYAFMRYSVTVMRGGVLRKNAVPAPYLYALFFVLMGFWIFRNTPFYPFVS